MATLEAKVSVDEVLHQALVAFADNYRVQYGIQLDKIEFDWYNDDLNTVHVESQYRGR